ncbi:DUF2690 domain-containing protein [Streptomyces sp. NPDC001068]|uniref:DUF2690 domain-containing protein n=1 Tax=Streptomyces sp. NPDC001068 TaxID=3364544 RepID=UPI003674228B
MITRSRLALMSASALLVAGGTLVAAPSASASASAGCYASSCYGKDPDSTGCSNDAQMIDRVPASGSKYVKLDYSPTCRAAWAKVVGADLDTEFWVATKNTGQEQVRYSYGAYGWTPMVNDAGTTSHACFYYYADDNTSKWCTIYY